MPGENPLTASCTQTCGTLAAISKNDSAQCRLWICACFNGNLKYAGGNMARGLTLRARELKHAWSRCAYFPLGEKMPRYPHRRQGLHGCTLAHASTHLGGPSIIVPAWSRPSISCPLRSTFGRRRRQPAQPARWRSRMLGRGKTYPPPAARPTPHEYLCVTSPQYLPFLFSPCVETCTKVYHPENHP